MPCLRKFQIVAFQESFKLFIWYHDKLFRQHIVFILQFASNRYCEQDFSVSITHIDWCDPFNKTFGLELLESIQADHIPVFGDENHNLLIFPCSYACYRLHSGWSNRFWCCAQIRSWQFVLGYLLLFTWWRCCVWMDVVSGLQFRFNPIDETKAFTNII